MGKLFLIVGNSGSGKDSLISEVQKHFPNNLKAIKVPKRVITRPPSPDTEDFESIDEKEFLELKEQGEFVLEWHIYELYYGVRKEILNWLNEGHPVLINVSRNIVEYARERFPGMKLIFVRVPYEITAARIKDRGRENDELLKRRLKRAKDNQEYPDADFVVDNSGELEEAGKKMLEYILSELK